MRMLRYPNKFSTDCMTNGMFRLSLIIAAVIFGFALYHRTTNMWALKNIGDTFLIKRIGRRPIVLGAFHRPENEINVPGAYAVIQFLGDTRQNHEIYCHSEYDGNKVVHRAHIERIHKGKRASSDICAWSGHLAECQIANADVKSVGLSTSNFLGAPQSENLISVDIEEPIKMPERQKLVVCMAPMYVYTEWQIMITGIETWLTMGATKIIFPIQSTSNATYSILKAYEAQGVVLLRHWPMWPVLSDVNPSGLVLSRGIEESHVNCLHFAKPFSDMLVFTDIDDMLLPVDPTGIKPNANVEILHSLFEEHPRAGSFLFEHRDVQFVLPNDQPINSLQNFNFNFLENTHWKSNCKVWRMKTRVVVNASRVDSVNMHETGIHRFGYVQVRVPCRQAHFYHLRHSYKNIGVNEWPINMSDLLGLLNRQFKNRLFSFKEISSQHIEKESTTSFEDFDKCMSAINEEHWTLKVSRCLTPYACYSRLARNVTCIASLGDYEFVENEGDFITVLKSTKFVPSENDCEAPIPKFKRGNHFYLP